MAAAAAILLPTAGRAVAAAGRTRGRVCDAHTDGKPGPGRASGRRRARAARAAPRRPPWARRGAAWAERSPAAGRGDHGAGPAAHHRRRARAAGRGLRRGHRLAGERPRDRRGQRRCTTARRSARPPPRSTARSPTPTPPSTGGFLAGGQEPESVVASGTRTTSTAAARLITEAAANSAGSPRPATRSRRLNTATAAVHGPGGDGPGRQPAGLPGRRRLSALRQRADARTAACSTPPRSSTQARTPRLRARLRATPRPCPWARAGRWASSRWPRWPGRSAATTGAPTGSSTAACSPRRRPPRWCCCGWWSGTPWPARS